VAVASCGGQKNVETSIPKASLPGAKVLACSSAIGWKSLLPDWSLASAKNVTIGGAGFEKLSHQTASGKAGTCNTQTDGIWLLDEAYRHIKHDFPILIARPSLYCQKLFLGPVFFSPL
jgi:hypothetical protein